MLRVVRLTSFIVMAWLSFSVSALESLHIKAGKPFVVGPKMANLDLESLVIDSKAVIQVNPSISMWAVSAKQAEISEGVVIRGAGLVGKDGQSGRSQREARRCDIGANGSGGRPGINGGSAVNISWSFGVKKFGNVNINLSGGSGGRGGHGGDGQNIPNIKNCATPGGDAGSGGNGGIGGNGGNFTLHYWLLDGADDISGNSISVKFNAGRGGKGGSAGFPGIGSPGQTIEGKWVAGGTDGSDGVSGRSGRTGRTGTLEIRKVADESGSSIVVEVPVEDVLDPTAEERLKTLDITVQKLEARIKLLELDKQ